MYFTSAWVFLGLLGFSMAVPVDQPYNNYNPKDFFSPSRIVGGSEAPQGVASHMVALLVGDWMAMLMCGGSIVSHRCVLTAAHCIEDTIGWNSQLLDSLRGAIGTHRWSDQRNAVGFSDYRIHPEWDRRTIKNDVGVLITKQKIIMSEGVEGIGGSVGVIPLNDKFVGGGQEVFVTGWGRIWLGGPIPDQLQKLFVTTLAPHECEQQIQPWGISSPPVNSSVEICTRHALGAGYGLCHGDSGSALVDKSGKQIGVVSWGFPCAIGFPDVLARVSAFHSWVHTIIKTTEK